ncbi:hypothetical protein [Simplicispira suum]|uniref:Uncharacterized protein n=1 Tax=Simplicispira suum TaxID=2109915 RepID=A0A2S0N5P4_9BURK|nr:hypothetical protein [Simplicispira suum]AVO43468.1 hypothetical protein C6571_18760 [Simplicispira suum]
MFFRKKVDCRSKEAMTTFLLTHNRYQVDNRAIGSGTSYANKIKLHNLGLRGSQLEKAFDIYAADDDFWPQISGPIRAFEHETDAAYSVARMGRSGGYLVLARAQYEYPGYKSTCSKCGKLNFQEAGPEAKCGVCHSPRVNLKKPLRWIRTTGSSIDHAMAAEDFMDLSMEDLKLKVDLVLRFDEVCDSVRERFLCLLDNYMVVEKTIMVPTKVRHLEPVL